MREGGSILCDWAVHRHSSGVIMARSQDIILTAVWCLGIGTPGLLLALYAKHYRDWSVRQLQKRSTVIAYRVMGAFLFAVSVIGGCVMIRDILVGAPVWH